MYFNYKFILFNIQAYYCDGHDDCGDNSDEPENCKVCDSVREFMCENGACILLTDVCNGKNDCGDNSDENFHTEVCSKYSNYQHLLGFFNDIYF